MAWRFGGADPYRTYHRLGEDYRAADGSEQRPLWPSRLQHFLYGCALQAEYDEFKRVKAQAGG